MTRDLKYDLVLRSRRAVLPDGERPAAVAVRDGRIVAVTAYQARLDCVREEDIGNVSLVPGLVDLSVGAGAPGYGGRAGFTAVTKAAAAGGVTTIFDHPAGSQPPTLSAQALQAKRAMAQGTCAIDVGFWGGAARGNLAELEPLQESGVLGFKCSMAAGDITCGTGHAGGHSQAGHAGAADSLAALDNADLRAAFARLTDVAADTLVAVHAEDESEIRHASGRDYGTFLASRPARAERRAIEKVVAAAAATGVPAHIAPLAAAECVALIAGAKAAGIALTAETCPHYLFFAAEEVPDGATEFKCCPPIRDGMNREALWRGLEIGVIDCVASGHWPGSAQPPDPKGRHGGKHASMASRGQAPARAGRREPGDFGAAPGGISALQLSLPAMWTIARRRRHGLTDVIRWMAERPAALAGLHWKGRLAVGCDADLVAFDSDAEFTVRGPLLPDRNGATPYEGRVLAGAVRAVWLRGEPVSAGVATRGHLITRAKR